MTIAELVATRLPVTAGGGGGAPLTGAQAAPIKAAAVPPIGPPPPLGRAAVARLLAAPSVATDAPLAELLGVQKAAERTTRAQVVNGVAGAAVVPQAEPPLVVATPGAALVAVLAARAPFRAVVVAPLAVSRTRPALGAAALETPRAGAVPGPRVVEPRPVSRRMAPRGRTSGRVTVTCTPGAPREGQVALRVAARPTPGRAAAKEQAVAVRAQGTERTAAAEATAGVRAAAAATPAVLPPPAADAPVAPTRGGSAAVGATTPSLPVRAAPKTTQGGPASPIDGSVVAGRRVAEVESYLNESCGNHKIYILNYVHFMAPPSAVLKRHGGDCFHFPCSTSYR